MKAMIVKLGLLAVIAAVCVVIAMAYSRGRDSRYYRLIATVVTPVSDRLVRVDEPPLALPFEADLGAELDAQWRWFQPELTAVDRVDGALSMTPGTESVWWLNQRGPLVYRYLDGDGVVTTAVRVRKRSDNALPPDMEWQFGGIILRDPRGDAWFSLENYVFNVVGHRGRNLQVETKTTLDGHSRVDAWDWRSGDAELRIVRRGALFELAARPDAVSPWQPLISYERKDLPSLLQVGLIVYAYSEGRGRYDVQVFFDGFAVDRVASTLASAQPAAH